MANIYDPQRLAPIWQKKNQERVQKHKEHMDTAPRKFLSALSEGAGNQFAVAMGKLATDATRFEFFGGKEDLDLKLEKGHRDRQKGRRDQKTFDVIEPRERTQKLADREINDLRRMQPESMTSSQLQKVYERKALNILEIKDESIKNAALNDLMSMAVQHEGMAVYLEGIAKTKYGHKIAKNTDGTYTVQTSSPPRSTPRSAAEKKRIFDTASRVGAELLEMIEKNDPPEAIAKKRKQFSRLNKKSERLTGNRVPLDNSGNPLPGQPFVNNYAPETAVGREKKRARTDQRSEVFRKASDIITVENLKDTTENVESRFAKIPSYESLSPALKAQVANAVRTGTYVGVSDPKASKAVIDYAYAYHRDSIDALFEQTSESQDSARSIKSMQENGWKLAAFGTGLNNNSEALKRAREYPGGMEGFNTNVHSIKFRNYILTGIDK